MTSQMPRMNISLTKEQMKTLKDLAEKEHRPYSNQIVHMMEFYLKYRKNHPDDIGDLTELSYDLRDGSKDKVK